MKLPKNLNNLISHFEKLPGVGPKSAARLAFYVLKAPKHDIEDLANTLINVKNNLKFCSICHNVSESDLCEVCSDSSRDTKSICVVENVLNLIAVENTGFNGIYHVLGGVLNPINGVNSDDLFIEDLITRLSEMTDEQDIELILATNPTMEGESTAMFIKRRVEQEGIQDSINITRIGRGIPTGGDIEFADKTTLDNALQGRKTF
jgi:recombination protein RecR